MDGIQDLFWFFGNYLTAAVLLIAAHREQTANEKPEEPVS